MFDHWRINDLLESLGWKKDQIPYIKEGMVDAITGEWKDQYMRYTRDFESSFSKGYPEYDKQKKSAADDRETAYVFGHSAGEDLIRLWLAKMDGRGLSTTLDSTSGVTIGVPDELKSFTSKEIPM
jgi:hypothetical protein